MSLKSNVEELSKKVDELSVGSDNTAKKKKKVKRGYRVPMKYRSKRKYRKGKVLAIWFGSNHNLDFRWAEIGGGLVKVYNRDKDVNDYFAYEDGSIYFHKRLSIVGLFEWRLTPVGDSDKVTGVKLIGGVNSKDDAALNGELSHAQQTIIRAIKQEELAKDDGKKKKSKLGIGFIVLIVGLGLFLLGKLFGFV